MRTPKSQPLLEFLQTTEAWKSGDKELIEIEKKNYRKKYLTLQKQKSRKAKKHLTIILEDFEQKALQAGADTHGMSLQKYLKVSALHYHSGRFLVPHPNTYLQIKEIIFSIQRDIQELKNREGKRWFGAINDYQSLSDIVLNILPKTEKIFHQPITIEDSLKNRLTTEPQFRNTLAEILTTYDSQISL